MTVRQRDVVKAAKLLGLTLQSSAVKPLVRILESEENPMEALAFVLEEVKKHIDGHPGSPLPLRRERNVFPTPAMVTAQERRGSLMRVPSPR